MGILVLKIPTFRPYGTSETSGLLFSTHISPLAGLPMHEIIEPTDSATQKGRVFFAPQELSQNRLKLEPIDPAPDQYSQHPNPKRIHTPVQGIHPGDRQKR